MPGWTVTLSSEAKKQYKRLKRNGSKKPSVVDFIDLLALALEEEGPHLISWPNYSPLDKNSFHCHLRKGRPTYVACWRTHDKQTKKIEVYYVGSHEDAPY